MESTSLHSVDDQLIAAYIDGDVTAEERRRVESAMASNAQVAWEVDTLRQTVELLHELPSVPLPRSFVLSEDQVADVVAAPRGPPHEGAAPTARVEIPSESPWQRLLGLLMGGDPALRNAAALAAVLVVLVMVAETLAQPGQLGSPTAPNGQLSDGSTGPQIQVTAVGGSFSQTEESGSAGATPESVAVGGSQAETGDGPNRSDEGLSDEISIMIDGSDVEESGDQAPRPNEEVLVATPEPPTTRVTPGANAGESSSLLWNVLRSARSLLILAAVALWVLSRVRPRWNRA